MNPNVLITGHSRGLGRAFADIYKGTHNIIGVSSSEIDFLTLTQTPEYYLNNTYDIVFINALVLIDLTNNLPELALILNLASLNSPFVLRENERENGPTAGRVNGKVTGSVTDDV